MKNSKIKGLKILSKKDQKSINGGAINLPDPIRTCWVRELWCTTIGFPPLTGQYCEWIDVKVPCP